MCVKKNGLIGAIFAESIENMMYKNIEMNLGNFYINDKSMTQLYFNNKGVNALQMIKPVLISFNSFANNRIIKNSINN